MSDNLLAYIKGLFCFDVVVQRTEPTQWDNPSLCERWTARGIVDHQGLFFTTSAQPNNASELTAHTIALLTVHNVCMCGPPLKLGVRQQR